MADTPEIKELQKQTTASEQGNKELTKVNESIKAMTKAMSEQESPEAKKEKKTHDKAVLSTLKAMVKGLNTKLADGSKGLFGGIKKMAKKYLTKIMGLLGVGMLALFATMDMDKLKKLWVKFKEAITAIYEVMAPIVVAIGNWLAKTVLPATFDLFIATLDNITQMFTDIKGHFEGWDQKSGAEKFWSVIGAISSLGNALGRSALNISTWIEKTVFGGDGSFTKGIKDKLLTLFGPVEKKGSILHSVSKMTETVINFILPEEMAKTWNEKIKTFLGGADDGPESESIMGKIIGGFKAMLALFVIGSMFPVAWIGTALMFPLRAAIKLAMFGAKIGGGLIGKIASGIGGAMGKIPLGVGGGFMKGLMGVGTKLGILGLAVAVGKGMYDGYKVIEAGGTVQQAFETGIEGFLKVVTLGLLSPDIAKSWSQSIVSFFKSAYDLVFNKKEQDGVTGEYAEQKKSASTKAALKGGEKELKSQREALVQEGARLDPNSARSAQIGRSIAEINQQLGVGDVQPPAAEKSKADKAAALDAKIKKTDDQIAALAKKGGIKNMKRLNELVKQRKMLKGKRATLDAGGPQGFRWDKNQTRESSMTGMDTNSQSKLAVLGNMFGDGVKLTSGYRAMSMGDNAMINSKSDFRKTYKAKYLKGITDMGAPGSEERKAAVEQMRKNGFQSQHEHGNAIDFSYPAGFSQKTFASLKTTLLGAFPGANILGEKDHVHMAFNKKNSGIQLAQLQADSGMIGRAAHGTGNNGGIVAPTTINQGGDTKNTYAPGKSTTNPYVAETFSA